MTCIAMYQINGNEVSILGKRAHEEALNTMIKTMSEDWTINTNHISDGAHTFEDLYFHRAVLFSLVLKQYPDLAWRSKMHQDGTMFKDMFIVGITTPEGDYSYHYELKHWDLFDGVKVLPFAPKYDGHLPSDISRLTSLKKRTESKHVVKESHSHTESDLTLTTKTIKDIVDYMGSDVTLKGLLSIAKTEADILLLVSLYNRFYSTESKVTLNIADIANFMETY